MLMMEAHFNIDKDKTNRNSSCEFGEEKDTEKKGKTKKKKKKKKKWISSLL